MAANPAYKLRLGWGKTGQKRSQKSLAKNQKSARRRPKKLSGIFIAGKTILTPFQQLLLNLLASDNYISHRFYLTGGTALSKFYLKHRFSEDFYLFSEKEVYLPADPLLLGSQFKKAAELTDFPIMLKPFDVKDMIGFFLKEAQELEKEIFK